MVEEAIAIWTSFGHDVSVIFIVTIPFLKICKMDFTLQNSG